MLQACWPSHRDLQRERSRRVGEVPTALTISEDAEYPRRLITAGKQAWYSTTRGVVLHDRNAAQSRDPWHLTRRASLRERAHCMQQFTLTKVVVYGLAKRPGQA